MLKRYPAGDQLIGEDTQAPQIHTYIILLMLEYLWWRIVKSSTISLPRALDPSRPTEVT
jgi:hypothetical protein